MIRDFAKRAKLIAYILFVKLSSALGVRMVHDKYEALKDADGLLILSDWDEFKDIEPCRIKQMMKVPVVIDPLGVFDKIDFQSEGISYIVMGRGNI